MSRDAITRDNLSCILSQAIWAGYGETSLTDPFSQNLGAISYLMWFHKVFICPSDLPQTCIICPCLGLFFIGLSWIIIMNSFAFWVRSEIDLEAQIWSERVEKNSGSFPRVPSCQHEDWQRLFPYGCSTASFGSQALLFYCNDWLFWGPRPKGWELFLQPKYLNIFLPISLNIVPLSSCE